MKTRAKGIGRKILYVIATVFLLLFCLLDSVKTDKAFADEASVPVIEQTNVMDDLNGSVIDGEKFSAEKYVLSTGAGVSFINLAEYQYSYFENQRNQYGLYVYVCVPLSSSFLMDSLANQIQIAFGDGSSASYAKYPLTYINGATGTYEGIFHKYRVELTEAQCNTVLNILNRDERVYKISGLEMHKTTGELKEYGIAKTYRYSGYAKGLGKFGEESTLSCRSDRLETIDLEVKHANYRTESYENSVCDEINTVYFSVPDKYFDSYGGLQRIKAEWWEYKTNPIFVTNDEEAYEALYNYVGVNIGEYTDDLDYRVLWEEYYKNRPSSGNIMVNDLCFSKNYNGAMNDYEAYAIGVYLAQMDWLFYRDVEDSEDLIKDYKVSREEIKNYMKWYTSKFSSQTKLNGKYAEGLFTNSIDDDRLTLLEEQSEKSGYVCQEFDAGEALDLRVQQNQSFWDKLWHGVQYENIGIDPIIVLDESIRAMSASQFGKKYLIDEAQVQVVYDDCVASLGKGEHPVLFRFAVTDYYASTARFDKSESWEAVTLSEIDGYVAQMTEFLDFDIISLTFLDEQGTETVIAVVSDPIDIINGIDPPADMPTKNPKKNLWERFLEWLEKLWQKAKAVFIPIIIAIVGVILLLIFAPHLLVAFGKLLWKGIKAILKVLWWLICLPFKGIKALVNKKKGKSAKTVKAKRKRK